MRKVGVFKSSSAVVKNFRNMLEESLLNPDEELIHEPAGAINILMSQIGERSATAFFEQLMYKNEIQPSTAIKMRSLLRHLNSDELMNVFGNPSSMTFVVGFDEKDLIDAAVITEHGDKRLRLNRDLKMNVADFPKFTLDYDINIIVSTVNNDHKNIYAVFDTSDMNKKLANITNPIINTRIISYNGRRYFLMYLPMRQYERKVIENEIIGDKGVFYLEYTNNLMGVDVEYKSDNDSSFIRLDGEPDGTINLDGYNYSINPRKLEYGGGGVVAISFSKSTGAFNPTSGKLRFTVYQTEGKNGNFILQNLEADANLISVSMAQDRGNQYEEALTPIIPLVSVKDNESKNGRNSMTMEEIRAYIIERNHNNGYIIAPGELESRASNQNLLAYKVRSDIRSLEYRITGIIKDSEGIIVPTAMKDLAVFLDDLPISQEVNARIIKPGDIFAFQENDISLYTKEPTSFGQYKENFKRNIKPEYQFPYLMRIETGSEVKVNIYDISNYQNIPTEFLFFNDLSEDQTSMNSISIIRNALEDKFFKIEFKITVGDAMYDYYKTKRDIDPDRLLTKIVFKNRVSGDKFISKCSILYDETYPKNVLKAYIELKTTDAISSLGKIMITENSIQPFPMVVNPIPFYYLEENLDINIFTILKSNSARTFTQYDNVLTESEKFNNFYVSMVYESTNVNIFKELSDFFSITPDIQMTQPIYATYDTNIPKLYLSDIYDTNEDGSYKTTPVEVKDPITGQTSVVDQFVVLHRSGETMFNEDGSIMFEHRIGDTMVDTTGKPIIKTQPRYQLFLRSVPVYNRIFSFGKYSEIVSGYDNLLSDLQDLNKRMAGGCTLSMGVRTTTGAGKFKFFNLKTNSIDRLDSMALSFSLGLKPGGNTYGLDLDYLIIAATDEIIKYVNSFKPNDKVFSITKMIEEVKKNVPNIAFFEIYSINKYDAGTCQTIFLTDEDLQSRFDETLCVKYIIDEFKSDNNTIVYKPDISISIIN